jgi:hypothetical protein
MGKLRNLIFFFLMMGSSFYETSLAAIPAQWGTTSSKQNILFVESTPSHSLSELDPRLLKAMKAGEILILGNSSSVSGIEQQIREIYHDAGKPILSLNDSPPYGIKGNQSSAEHFKKLIQDYRNKKVVVVLGSEYYQGNESLIPVLKDKKMTFTPFASIPLWPVYVPSHHWTPPRRKTKPLPAPDMTRLAPILPRAMPEIPTPPPPEITKQPMGGRNSPFYRHYFPERSGR